MIYFGSRACFICNNKNTFLILVQIVQIKRADGSEY